jgi:putative flippase GtrA
MNKISGLIERFSPYRRTAGQFLRFSAVGTINFFLDYAVYIVLTRGLVFWGRHIVMATTASFIVAVTSSFVLNTFWTFRCDAAGWHKRVWKFFVVAAGGLALNALILFVLTGLGVYDLLAKLAATAIVLVWNFFLQKKWTFRL